MELYNIVVGSHPVMRAIVAAVERLAGSDRPVIITGEKGTGKGLIARRLHACSARAGWPFVHIDCGQESQPRLERELCEPEQPATAWQRAAGGVLFLDELNGLSIEIQQRLAALLADGRAASVAGVRLIGTAQHDLASGVTAGRLIPELVERMEPVEIPLPSLRQRRADIPALVEHFLDAYALRHNLPPCRIETEALVHLWQYDWPGNVRELESVIERVVVLCRTGLIRTADLPRHIYAGKLRPGGPGRSAPSNGNGAPTLRPSL